MSIFFRALQQVKLLEMIFNFRMQVMPLNTMKKRRVVRTNLTLFIDILKRLMTLASIGHQVIGNIIKRGKIEDW